MSYADFARVVTRRVSRDLSAIPYRWRRHSQVRQYLESAEVPRLHLGAGAHDLPGWLNTDLVPRGEEVYLDSTRPYPFAEGTFCFVYHHHLIEHMPYPRGCRLLAECLRVLRPGGRVRIATPDLAFLLELHRSDKSEVQRRYVEWASRRFTPYAPQPHETFVTNNYVRDWGHHFIYDRAVLTDALSRAGFVDMRNWGLNESDEPVLRGLEHENRMPEGFLALETMVIEGRKPDGG